MKTQRCKEYDDAISEAFRDSLPEDHPGYAPSTYTLEQQEYEAIRVAAQQALEEATK